MRYYTDVCHVTGGYTFFNGGRKISKAAYLKAFDRICVKPSEFAKDTLYCPEWDSCPFGHCAPLKDSDNVFYVLLVHRHNPENEYAEILPEKVYYDRQIGHYHDLECKSEANAAKAALQEDTNSTEEGARVPDNVAGRPTPNP